MHAHQTLPNLARVFNKEALQSLKDSNLWLAEWNTCSEAGLEESKKAFLQDGTGFIDVLVEFTELMRAESHLAVLLKSSGSRFSTRLLLAIAKDLKDVKPPKSTQPIEPNLHESPDNILKANTEHNIPPDRISALLGDHAEVSKSNVSQKNRAHKAERGSSEASPLLARALARPAVDRGAGPRWEKFWMKSLQYEADNNSKDPPALPDHVLKDLVDRRNLTRLQGDSRKGPRAIHTTGQKGFLSKNGNILYTSLSDEIHGYSYGEYKIDDSDGWEKVTTEILRALKPLDENTNRGTLEVDWVAERARYYPEC